jgi:hypothetical protein
MTIRGSARWEFPRADPPGIRRVLVGCSAVGLTLGLSVGLTGCANGDALGLVRQACHHVKLSLALYHESERETNATVAADDRAQAQDELQAASPLAAQAAGQAPQWQALMATLAETSRLPEADVVPALQLQCAVAQNGGATVPTLPGTTLPGTTLPGPPGTSPGG